MSFITDIFKGFFSGIKEGFTDLVNWNKDPREKPLEREDSSWQKYFKYSEWRFWAIREVTAQIVVVLVLLIIIRETIGEFRFIPSESMEPTLKIGDKLFVEKFSKIFRGANYNRGDIVIFYPPPEATEGKEVLKYDPFSVFARLTGLPFLPQPEAYIKRVIGIPGDKIQIKKHLGVLINGKSLNEPYHFDSMNYLPEYDTKLIRVPEGYYFVLGDNRNQSFDSHFWGLLPKERIVGRAAFLIYRTLDEKPKINQ
jgi:signal peptidase I